MSHEIDTTTGAAAFAFSGVRADIWHRLGHAMPEHATAEDFAEMPGLTFRIKRSNVRYFADREGTNQLEMPDQHVLFRTDTLTPLGVVGDQFKVVQPATQFEFFAEFCRLTGAKMSTAGVLFGGKQLFGSAQIGSDIRIVGTDSIRPFIMFHTANDGTASTTIRNVATRPVCNNTVRAAFKETKQGVVTLTHRSHFDPNKMAAQLAAWVETQRLMAEQFRLLAQTPVSTGKAEDIVTLVLNARKAPQRPREDGTMPAARDVRNTAAWQGIMSMFNGVELGANLPGVRGTAWGLFNGFTAYADHASRAISEDHRFASSQFGSGADLKDDALKALLQVATTS